MMIIIRGRARVELCPIKKKDQEKHYFCHRNSQLYKMYPDDLHRMTTYRYGKLIKQEEEVIVYPENSLIPDHPRGESYEFDKMAAELDEHKLMAPKSAFGGMNMMIKQANQIRTGLRPMLPMLIVCCVLAYAFLFGGH